MNDSVEVNNEFKTFVKLTPNMEVECSEMMLNSKYTMIHELIRRLALEIDEIKHRITMLELSESRNENI